MTGGALKPFHRLPLLAKMLIPFIALTVVVGVFGVVFVTQDLSKRADEALNADLARRVVEARSFLHDRELYALESANYAANLQGMATAIRNRDETATAKLLESAIALRSELVLAAATGPDGVGLVELRAGGGARPVLQRGGRWRAHPFVREALRSRTGDRRVGTIASGQEPMVAVAAPVCAGTRACEPVGVAIVGVAASSLLTEATSEPSTSEGRALFDANGRTLTKRGIAIPAPAGPIRGNAVRRTIDADGEPVAVLYAPYSLRGRHTGTIAIGIPTRQALAAARDAAGRLALILVVSIAGVVIVASLLVRMIVGQVRELVETNRKLGAGDLSARAGVRSGDEIGELAHGVNTMAEKLEAAVETLELRVDQRTEEIKRLLEQRTQFFASLSHEFRTPLAVILAQSDRLDDRRAGNNGRRRTEDITATIRYAADQALQIVNDVLDLAKAETHRVELRAEPIDTGALLREIRPTVEGLAAAGSIEVRLDVPADLPAVHADRMRVREILLNLADNAVKYTPHGGRVTVSAWAEDDLVAISVTDTGHGIPDDVGAKIFEPFYRVPGSEPEHGRRSSGLGLALTRRLVEAHGGTIGYRPAPDGGTIFTFTLPIAGPPEPDDD